MSTAHTTYYHSPAMRGIVSTDIHVDPLYNPTASPANGCLCREEFQHKPALDRPFSRPRMAGKPGQPALIPCSHVAVSAARSRRDHCLIWTRFATPAAGRRRVVHLHAPVLHDVHRLLDSLTQLDTRQRPSSGRCGEAAGYAFGSTAQRTAPPSWWPSRKTNKLLAQNHITTHTVYDYHNMFYSLGPVA